MRSARRDDRLKLHLRNQLLDDFAVPALAACRRTAERTPGILAIEAKLELAAKLWRKLPEKLHPIRPLKCQFGLIVSRRDLPRGYLPGAVATDTNGFNIRQQCVTTQCLPGLVQHGGHTLTMFEPRPRCSDQPIL